MPASPYPPLRTAADELIEVVRRRRKISIEDLAKALRVPFASVQALVDFLVEEKMLGIEYKFTTPYVYLNEEARERDKRSFLSKEEFYQQARSRGTPEGQLASLWKSYLDEKLPQIRQEFMAKALSRGVIAQQAEEMWQKYLGYL